MTKSRFQKAYFFEHPVFQGHCLAKLIVYERRPINLFSTKFEACNLC